MDNHLSVLGALCRVCGNRHTTYAEKSKKKSGIQIVPHIGLKIEKTFSICLAEDNLATHPTHVCLNCYSKTKDHLQADYSQDKFTDWQEHAEACSTCERYNAQCKGGRPPKKKRGRPPVPPTKAVENEFSIVAQAVIQKPLTAPVTQDMERVAAHIIKSKMHQSGGIVTELSTGTQVIIFIN